MNDIVFVMTNSKLAQKKQTRKPTQINIDDCSSHEEWIMDDEHGQNEALDWMKTWFHSKLRRMKLYINMI